MRGGELRRRNEKGEPAGFGKQSGSRRQNVGESLYCAHRDNVKRSGREGFCSRVFYIYVRQFKHAHYFPKERRLLLVRFDKRESNFRSPEFDRNPWEARARPNVSQGD